MVHWHARDLIQLQCTGDHPEQDCDTTVFSNTLTLPIIDQWDQVAKEYDRLAEAQELREMRSYASQSDIPDMVPEAGQLVPV